jgi:hypothetical protein
MERKCGFEGCGKAFQPKREDQKYCTPQCRLLAWNQYRCTSISKEARKKKSLRSDFRNPVLAVAREVGKLNPLLAAWILTVASKLRIDARKQERQCAREKQYHQAEHWRAVAVFAEQIKRAFL